MTEPLLHPAWACLGGALIAALAPAPVRRLVVVAAPAVAAALVWTLPSGARSEIAMYGQQLTWLRADALATTFALVFALIGALAGLYGLPGSRRLHVAGLAATAAGLGIVLAGDWLSLYLWWEALAVASFVLILDGGRPLAGRAALRYLLVHIGGGTLLLGGIVWHLGAGGERLVGPLAVSGAGALILLAFAVNAAIPPLHAWLTDAYPESSPAGSVFLSAFATKAAVYALARVFAGADLLVPFGVAMALYGVVFAVLENDIRRLLAYHIVSQVGYMVTGVGLGTPMAINGAAAHAFAHILYKGLLFMGAGAVVHATGRRTLTELGGLARAMPLTLALYMIGAFSISGAPLLNGFVSKALVVAAAEADHRELVALLLHLASVGTFLHTGLKLPYFTFAGPDRGLRPEPVPRAMLAAMGLTAALCVLTGLVPGLLYRLLPHPVDWNPYTAAHVLESLQLLTGTGVAFLLLRHALGGEPTATLDTDRLYRAAGRAVAHGLAPLVARGATALEAVAAALVTAPLEASARPVSTPVGLSVLVAVAALGLALIVFLPGR